MGTTSRSRIQICLIGEQTLKWLDKKLAGRSVSQEIEAAQKNLREGPNA